ncbi:uncharacterized protein A4U43_C04F34460 [Asparagus officinalis]|uniref:Uncharacterized protein n=1 Tax=Asparagus officinalis TaxID=4686 RepID=A0A5P1FB10_ASPOF|nr:uncharacterized protein A4U43_C04F34460 [Asparagus officinalis]
MGRSTLGILQRVQQDAQPSGPLSLKTGLEYFDDGVYEDYHELSYNRSPFIDDDDNGSDEEPEDLVVPQPVNSPNEEGTASEDEEDDLIVVPGIL